MSKIDDRNRWLLTAVGDNNLIWITNLLTNTSEDDVLPNNIPSALTLAISNKCSDSIIELLQEHLTVQKTATVTSKPTKVRNRWLLEAIVEKNAVWTKNLLIKNNDHDVLPDNISSALAFAISIKSPPEIIELLQKYHLHVPITAKVFRKLVTSNVKIQYNPDNSNTESTNNSTLMVMLFCNPAKALQELEDGVISLEEINHQNSKSMTALHFLAQYGHSFDGKMISLLMDQGANVNLPLSNGTTPLMLAVSQSQTTSDDKTVKLFLNHPNINVNAQDDLGQTALLLACAQPNFTSEYSMEKLLAHPKIDINLQDTVGDTPLMMACRTYPQNNFLLKLLDKPGLNIYHKNKDGEMAINHCESKHLADIFKLLSEYRGGSHPPSL